VVGAETVVFKNASCSWVGSRRGVRREIGGSRNEGMNEREYMILGEFEGTGCRFVA
jgi:hypothetical protein